METHLGELAVGVRRVGGDNVVAVLVLLIALAASRGLWEAVLLQVSELLLNLLVDGRLLLLSTRCKQDTRCRLLFAFLS